MVSNNFYFKKHINQVYLIGVDFIHNLIHSIRWMRYLTKK